MNGSVVFSAEHVLRLVQKNVWISEPANRAEYQRELPQKICILRQFFSEIPEKNLYFFIQHVIFIIRDNNVTGAEKIL